MVLSGAYIVLVEDDEIMGASLLQRMQIEGAQVTWLKQIARAIGAIRSPRKPIDAVVCDIRLPDGTGESLYEVLCKTTTPPPFLFITGHGGIEQAVRLMRAGAADYVAKPFDMPVLLDRLSGLIRNPPHDEFPALLGVSPAARRVEERARNAAVQDRNVLIIGGPGTGKSLVARRIHKQSDRSAAPFISVNLAREANATAAIFSSGGALDQVGEGILYLHALSLLPKAAQGKMLEVLEHGFSGRIIASCGQEISTIRAQGNLQTELFYRLDLVDIPVPPLSERPEDAVWLMTQLFPAMNARRAVPLKSISRLTEEAVRSHDWTGGGRELRARLAQGVAGAPGPMLQPADLFSERAAASPPAATLAQVREKAERQHIIDVLDQCGGQLVHAAKVLNVSRTTLWDKMQKYDIGRGSR